MKGKVLKFSNENAHLPFHLLTALLSINLVLAAGSIILVSFYFTFDTQFYIQDYACRYHTMHTKLSKYNCHDFYRALWDIQILKSLKTLNLIAKGISNVSSCSLSNNDFIYTLKLVYRAYNLSSINLQTYCTIFYSVFQKLFL